MKPTEAATWFVIQAVCWVTSYPVMQCFAWARASSRWMQHAKRCMRETALSVW